MADEKPEIVFHFVEDRDCRTYYANGAFGGVSPKGEIVVNFLVDHAPLPVLEANQVEADGAMGPQTRREERYGSASDPESVLHAERRVVARVVMHPGVAQSVAQWLSGQVDLALKGRDQGKKK